MTQVFGENGELIPVTVIEATPNVVLQVKTLENDSYSALQLGYQDKRQVLSNKPEQGHVAKANTTPKRYIREIRDAALDEHEVGQEVSVEIFAAGDVVDVTGTSKGKGFQGVVKRHGFGGVGQATHGQHNRLRAPGSIGAGSDPSRVFKGMRMAGRMGGKQVTVQNLQVLKVDEEQNLLVVKGAVPGAKNSYVIVRRWS